MDEIESVIEQGLEGVEHFVMDGGSTDGTVEILKQYPHLKWVSEKDGGQSDALNKGIAQATGDVICWINSDDYYAPGAFEAVRRHFAANPESAMLCGNEVVVDELDRVTKHAPPRLRREMLQKPWVGGTSVFQQGVIFRREVWENCGPIDAGLCYAMDYDFFLKATARYPLTLVPADIGCFRVYSGTKTGDAFGPAYAEVKQALLRFRQDRGALERAWIRHKLDAYEARVWVCDAMLAEERGELPTAQALYRQAFGRNPFSLLCYPHVCFRLRGLLGIPRYEALRRWVREIRS